MATYFDMLPAELVEVIFEKKHKLEFRNVLLELNNSKRKYFSELSYINEYHFVGDISIPCENDTHSFNGDSQTFSDEDIEKYCVYNKLILTLITSLYEWEEYEEFIEWCEEYANTPVEQEFISKINPEVFNF